jgi:hypothetical protein
MHRNFRVSTAESHCARVRRDSVPVGLLPRRFSFRARCILRLAFLGLRYGAGSRHLRRFALLRMCRPPYHSEAPTKDHSEAPTKATKITPIKPTVVINAD